MARRLEKRSFLFMTLLTLACVGCSNSKPEVTATGNGKATDKKATDDDDDDSSGKDKKLDTPSPGNETNDAFKGCGFNAYGDANAVINQQLGSSAVRFHGFAGTIFTAEYNVVVGGTLGFQGSLESLTTSTTFNIVSADPPNARDKANTEINKITGSRVARMLEANKWEALFGSGDWQGLHCSVLPALGIVETTGNHTTTLEFNPPLPYVVSPLMTKKRFLQEFPAPKTFDGIEAKVVQTNNPLIATGMSKPGSVTITPVEPNASLIGASGVSTATNADYAFRLEFNFGDHAGTGALGLNKVATYYVKGGKFEAIIVETGVADAPVVNYGK